jgi:hypothetical protein
MFFHARYLPTIRTPLEAYGTDTIPAARIAAADERTV